MNVLLRSIQQNIQNEINVYLLPGKKYDRIIIMIQNDVIEIYNHNQHDVQQWGSYLH